jgi:hypothetical protein
MMNSEFACFCAHVSVARKIFWRERKGGKAKAYTIPFPRYMVMLQSLDIQKFAIDAWEYWDVMLREAHREGRRIW